MRCSIEDCYNETQQRCHSCGEPVCWNHGQWADILFTFPSRWFTSAGLVCERCMTRQPQESEQALRELVGVD
jgi:hypothetical protein